MIDMETGDVHLDKGLVIKCCMPKKDFVETFFDEFFDAYKETPMEETIISLTPRLVEGVPLYVRVLFEKKLGIISSIEIFHEDNLCLFEKDKRTVSDQEMYELLYAIARRDFSKGTRILSWGHCGFGRSHEGSSAIVVDYYLHQRRRKA